jgi:hypothetical protein
MHWIGYLKSLYIKLVSDTMYSPNMSSVPPYMALDMVHKEVVNIF